MFDSTEGDLMVPRVQAAPRQLQKRRSRNDVSNDRTTQIYYQNDAVNDVYYQNDAGVVDFVCQLDWDVGRPD